MKRYFKYIYIPLICILTILMPLKVSASSITFNKSTITLGTGISATIQYTLGEGLNGSDIVWTSSNESVAIVNDGIVTAISEGDSIITASIDGYKATCKIIVNSDYIKVTGIKLNKSNTNLLVGETETLKATISPSDATSKDVVWTSSNPSVATINSAGKITAKSVGTTIITASINGYKATCQVNVVFSLSLKEINLDKTNITLKEKATTQLNVIYNPTNATNQKVTWKSSNNNIVTVSSTGLVTAKSKGSATITVVSNDGGYIATCKVIVEEISKKVTGIKLDKTDLKLLAGETSELKATITPNYAENKNVIWTSSDENIATVENGKVTALYPGTVEIKAISEDGEKEAVCKITITSPPLEAISFTEAEQTIYVDGEITLNVITSPTTAILEGAVWTSSVLNVATVENGKVIALSPGETIITVSNQDGTISASTKIIVVEVPKEPLNITVEGYNINFNPDTLNYDLKIGNESELKITTNVDENDIIIKGNQNLTKGSIITITYSETNVTYVINIQKKQNYTIYFIAAISLLLLLNLIRILIKSKKKTNY